MTTPLRSPSSDAPHDTDAVVAEQLLRLIGNARLPVPATRRGDGASEGDRYRQLLESLGVAVYTTDADGRITFYNRAAAEFWGREPELGELWCGSLRIYHPDGRPMPHDQCPMAVALRENRPVRGAEGIAERPDGTRVSFVPYPTPLQDENGTLIGGVNVMIDVTERRRAEEALRTTAQELRMSSAVKDEFLGLVSHELRTPVTTIFGNARLLRERGARLDDDDRAQMVEDISADSERLLGIVENLLLLTRLESGAHVELEPQVLGHVVRKAVVSYRGRHPERPVELVGAPRHVIVEADHGHLEMIIENLLSNADKYSPPATTVEVVVRRAGDEAQVLVMDRGIGIDEADIEKVFTPFYRAEPARSTNSGVGIGLAVCRRVVESLGGRIWAQPRGGGGTEIGFALPVADEAPEREPGLATA